MNFLMSVRKIQIEKMKKFLVDSIGDRAKIKRRKKRQKKNRLMYEKQVMNGKKYELFMEKKQKKIENYYEILDEWIIAKNQKMTGDKN